MKPSTALVAVAVLLAGCASSAYTPGPPQQAAGDVYTGEVWTWDQPNSIVTLRQGGTTFRVHVTPDQLRTLELHQIATVRGQLAPPEQIATTITPVGPTRAVPRGAPANAELTGTVSAADTSGRVAVTTPHGALHVLGAANADQRFHAGTPVRVLTSVQPVDLVPATAPETPTPAPVEPAASVTSAPADVSVVIGRVLGIDPGGLLLVESPSGPVQVWLPDTSAYTVGQTVQVRMQLLPQP